MGGKFAEAHILKSTLHSDFLFFYTGRASCARARVMCMRARLPRYMQEREHTLVREIILE